MNTRKYAQYKWWDSLTVGRKAMYGQIFKDCVSTQSLIEEAYKLYLSKEHKTHLRIVK